MKAFVKLIWVFSFLTYGCLAKVNQASVPVVAVSIKPLHSIVSQLMHGMNQQPKLIFQGSTSPHSAAVVPSMLSVIRQAKLLVWVGGEYETRLKTAVAARQGQTLTVLQDNLNIYLYSPRQGNLWAGGNHNHHHHHHHSHDPHVWLDPRNAKVIAVAICTKLKDIDPINKQYYERNKVHLLKKLDQLIAALSKKLQSHKGQNYIVYHDSTQYFDRYFGITAVGSIVLEPGMPVSAGHIQRLRDYLSSHGNTPIFVEMPYSVDSVAKYFSFPGIKAGSMEPTKIGVVDPVGLGVKPGPQAYFDILHHLADNLIIQLERSS